MENVRITRGDIYYADLEPVVGSEQGGVRPVLVVQNNRGNENSPTLVVAAITARRKSQLPTHVKLKDIGSIEKNSIILLEQLRTIDRKRLRSYIGSISPMTQGQVDRALAVSVGIVCI